MCFFALLDDAPGILGILGILTDEQLATPCWLQGNRATFRGDQRGLLREAAVAVSPSLCVESSRVESS